jgi:hypothetical protein
MTISMRVSDSDQGERKRAEPSFQELLSRKISDDGVFIISAKRQVINAFKVAWTIVASDGIKNGNYLPMAMQSMVSKGVPAAEVGMVFTTTVLSQVGTRQEEADAVYPHLLAAKPSADRSPIGKLLQRREIAEQKKNAAREVLAMLPPASASPQEERKAHEARWEAYQAACRHLDAVQAELEAAAS